MKRKYYLIAILLACFTTIIAQIPNAPTTALSPNAAELGKYGNIPISYFTGTPNIAIPLYNQKFKDFDLDLSLNYHASGIRPDQRVGWTGLGWSLFAGGIINRKRNGYIDEYNNPNYYNNSGYQLGYYFNCDAVNNDQWNQRTYIRSLAQQTINKDYSPDEFSFSFDGYTGTFYLKHDKTWVVKCNKPVKVIFDGNFLSTPFPNEGRSQLFGNTKSFAGFTIISENGTQYIFGQNTNAIEYSIDFFNQNTHEWYANSWLLTKIILPTGQEIVYNYERNDFICQMDISFIENLGSFTEKSDGSYEKLVCSSWGFNTDLDKSYGGMLISPVYLNSITTPNSIVTLYRSFSNELKYAQKIFDWNFYFNFDINEFTKFLPYLQSSNEQYPECLNNLKWYKLDSIITKNRFNNEKINKITLEYNISSNEYKAERLFLKKVSISDKVYVLSYDNPTGLPEYLSNKVDHWGFFNNTFADIDDINYYDLRNPNKDCATYGMLSKIQYPTGGYTEFEFESNYYRKQLSQIRWENCVDLNENKLAGGVRIKKIKTTTGNSQEIKEYFYVTDYLQNKENSNISSGVLGGQVQYFFNNYIVYAFNLADVKTKMSLFTSNSVLPACNNSMGSHIGYSQVVEKENDNSFRVLKFTNFDNGYLDESSEAIIQYTRTPYDEYNSKSQDRGLLLSSEIYNSNNIKVKTIEMEYETDKSTDNYVRALYAVSKHICPENSILMYDEGVAYKIYTYLKRPKSETISYFDINNETKLQTEITTYSYNAQNLLKSIVKTNSNNKT